MLIVYIFFYQTITKQCHPLKTPFTLDNLKCCQQNKLLHRLFFQSALTFYFSFVDKIFLFDIQKIFADGKKLLTPIFYFVHWHSKNIFINFFHFVCWHFLIRYSKYFRALTIFIKFSCADSRTKMQRRHNMRL